jgi:hypothetical protein
MRQLSCTFFLQLAIKKLGILIDIRALALNDMVGHVKISQHK